MKTLIDMGMWMNENLQGRATDNQWMLRKGDSDFFIEEPLDSITSGQP